MPFETQFFDSVKSAKDATPIRLRNGEMIDHLDFHLNPLEPREIRGYVRGVPELPHGPDSVGAEGRTERLIVTIAPAGNGPRTFGSAGSDFEPPYRFSFGGYPPGEYRLDASAGAPGGRWTASQIVDTRENSVDVVLNLEPARDITGQLRVDGPAHKPSEFQVLLSKQAGPGNNMQVSAKVAADGSFTLKQVPAGEWVVNINPLPAGAYLKAASFGGRDVRLRRFSVGAESSASATLSIVIGTHMAVLEGSIDVQEATSTRAGILVTPIGTFHDFERFYYGTISDKDGNFRIRNIVPGTYRVFALEKLEPANFRNPETADRLTALGANAPSIDIELKEDAIAEVHPKPIPLEVARGHSVAGPTQ